MEKKIGSKEVKMQAVVTPEGKSSGTSANVQPQKLSYEELNQACMELSQQVQQQDKFIRQMRQQMQQMDFALQTKRMDYLLKVVELHNNCKLNICNFSTDFVEECIAEIQESLTIPKEEEKKEVVKEN